ncbi:hypothetical protein SAMN06265368_4042 [Cohaesibacter gelatinilyticus]|uniref:SMODS and SLOG-associating 2TM effector domain-containing protein n=2 Tax=Cohaesibacter gelatinilyticus TaxID=372072 RepID=A0A285PHN0_9HYPH|nr:hypothetical protein SAMN06265368_4042 [Cohaesibacter gelatinilyticus]
MAKRLEKKADVKSNSMNVLSMFTLFAGVLSLAYSVEISADMAKLVGGFVIGVSALSIYLSHTDPVSRLAEGAFNAHECGREISKIYTKLLNDRLEHAQALELYEEVLSNYDMNHDRCDYYLTIRLEPDLFPDNKKGSNWWNSTFATWLSVVSPAIYTTSGLAFIFIILTLFWYLTRIQIA